MKKERGITLIALVITIIVLLILAAISIATLTGDNGILTKANEAKVQTERATVEEKVQMEAMASFDNNGKFNANTFKEKIVALGGSIVSEDENEIVVELDGYEAVVDAKTGEVKSVGKGGVRPEINVTQEVDGTNKKVTVTVEVTNDVGTVDSITVTNKETGEVFDVTVSGKKGTFDVETNGNYQIEVKATTEGSTRTTKKTVEVSEIEIAFSTAYGKIDVIWIDKGNNPIEAPLPPTGTEGMTKVYWEENEGTGEIKEITENDDGFDASKWYEYKAKTGNGDNTESKWANAINTVNGSKSYFVWIPRYAYRIMYYADKDYKQLSGYCDGRGFVDSKGNVMTKEVDSETIELKLDEGIEKVEKDGISYIVHPAFETDVNNGGWKDEDLAGIWVAKYEMSKEVNGGHQDTTSSSSGNVKTSDTIKAVSVPGVSSWRYINIGNCYTNGQNYDRDKESHLMKNSEWGAVAYLTHSQYGRNGEEITQNTDPGYYTGGETGATAKDNPGQSSTGNSYGIYDLSGCAYEYVAAYDQASTSNNLTNYGGSFAEQGGTSDQYSTTYTNGTSTYSGNKIYQVGKIGDATKEVYNGNTSTPRAWFTEFSSFVGSSSPFFKRGGDCGSSNAGVFCSTVDYGDSYNTYSWRVVLAGV